MTDWQVELVRGRLDEPTSRELIEFWTGHGALDEATARERLAQVVCLVRDDGGELAGVNSVYAAVAPLVGRRFWIYRRFVRPGIGHDAELAMIGAAFDALASEYAGGEPVGLCVPVTDQELIRARPEAIWPEVDLTYAGYTPQGTQIRIRYFDGAMI